MFLILTKTVNLNENKRGTVTCKLPNYRKQECCKGKTKLFDCFPFYAVNGPKNEDKSGIHLHLHLTATTSSHQTKLNKSIHVFLFIMLETLKR